MKNHLLSPVSYNIVALSPAASKLIVLTTLAPDNWIVWPPLLEDIIKITIWPSSPATIEQVPQPESS